MTWHDTVDLPVDVYMYSSQVFALAAAQRSYSRSVHRRHATAVSHLPAANMAELELDFVLERVRVR